VSKLVMAISGTITAFILALTAAAVYASRTATVAAPVVNKQASSPAVVSLQRAAVPAAPAATVNVSPQDAASIASDFLKRTDLYSVEMLADYQGVQAFKVTFSSGDIVYVGMDGKIISSELPPTPQVITVIGDSGHHGGGGGGGGGSGSSYSGGDDGSGEHEGGGDH
jgi:uncharacterized membrane protein YgcG